MNSQQQATSETPILELRQVSKHFRGVKALTQVDFNLRAGEVHGVVGENGAGKSTLIKILSGVYSDYEGQMILYGKPVCFSSPANARAQGIGIVHQPITRLGLSFNATRPMSSVSVGTQQMADIARTVFADAQIIILDEPTSSLSLTEVHHLFVFIERLKAQGKSIIFISHFLEDILQTTDRVTVFKHGQRVATHQTSELTKRDIVSLMLGTKGHILLPAYEMETARNRRAATEEGNTVPEVSHSRMSSGSLYQCSTAILHTV